MEKLQLHLYLSILSLLCYFYKCCAMESPQYTVVLSSSDMEIRLYKESLWISALVQPPTTFEKSTEYGFHRLYQYIHGANTNSSRINMTAPILTSINEAAANSSNNYVKFYLPMKYAGATLQPSPELNLQIEKWKSHCIAVRKFPGFAKDDNIDKEKGGLIKSLDNFLSSGKNNNISVVIESRSAYSIAQYNASTHLSGRLNEVWMNVSAKACPLY